MQLVISSVLSAADVAKLLTLLRNAPAGEGWLDGVATSGKQSAQVKNNQQMPEHGKVTQQARELVVGAISRHPSFMTAALPRRLYPPNFNRYTGSANTFGAHIDNALRTLPGAPGFLRTDLSCTLFLSEPDSYAGGELVIQAAGGEQAYKLPAGSLLLYPANTVHRVNPVTSGERIACFFWIESMVRSQEQRELLYELDMTIMAQRTRELQRGGKESAESVRLTGTYHNLLRMWAQP
ncbi:Fe2+-dependent dioxygenase [Variovorax sp. PCZ-1]|uniref:Fe2+-dependent dioxygenase n=1 Tax=Variovorax sp. PCZ-1 TaxID=2835533 RepID=UPI001BCBCB1E|nr:Fe2+-dependent dioxygenase [Variovorax sp. PCZ-1]MBS7807735.1 Fe2+-dependent dioxygenase [Variovorax sp. PCZ-1]